MDKLKFQETPKNACITSDGCKKNTDEANYAKKLKYFTNSFRDLYDVKPIDDYFGQTIANGFFEVADSNTMVNSLRGIPSSLNRRACDDIQSNTIPMYSGKYHQVPGSIPIENTLRASSVPNKKCWIYPGETLNAYNLNVLSEFKPVNGIERERYAQTTR